MASNRRATELKRRAEKKARKARGMSGDGDSVYARKRRGIYPQNSPYRTTWAAYA